jgi:hypothetical protein
MNPLNVLARLRPLFEAAFDDLDDAERATRLVDVADGLIRASYVMGRIAEYLDAKPQAIIDGASEDWNAAVAIFNRISEKSGFSWKMDRLSR